MSSLESNENQQHFFEFNGQIDSSFESNWNENLSSESNVQDSDIYKQQSYKSNKLNSSSIDSDWNDQISYKSNEDVYSILESNDRKQISAKLLQSQRCRWHQQKSFQKQPKVTINLGEKTKASIQNAKGTVILKNKENKALPLETITPESISFTLFPKVS